MTRTAGIYHGSPASSAGARPNFPVISTTNNETLKLPLRYMASNM